MNASCKRVCRKQSMMELHMSLNRMKMISRIIMAAGFVTLAETLLRLVCMMCKPSCWEATSREHS